MKIKNLSGFYIILLFGLAEDKKKLSHPPVWVLEIDFQHNGSKQFRKGTSPLQEIHKNKMQSFGLAIKINNK